MKDYSDVVADLRQQAAACTAAADALESLSTNGATRSFSHVRREAMSIRMKEHWAARRASSAGTGAAAKETV